MAHIADENSTAISDSPDRTCSYLAISASNLALKSPTLQQVTPPIRTGFGSWPVLLHLHTVGADTPNNSATVGSLTRPEFGSESN